MDNSLVEAVRAFNRFYTRRIGLLGEGHLSSPFSLTEARVLYELVHRDTPVASELAQELGLDAGYLSRILQKFEKQGFLVRRPSAEDRRQSLLRLTAKGRRAFAPLEKETVRGVAAMLEPLSDAGRGQMLEAMRTIQRLLGGPEADTTVVLRPHRPGDMGWVIHRHGVIYSQEQGWGELFEALVAEIAAHFIQHFDERRERCWIAETSAGIVGSVFLVKQSDEIAKLRLLLVEPSARGLGIGKRLVDECIRFARQAGYKTITLWTQDILHAATHIYYKAGFRLVRETPHQEFGIPMTAQTWDLTL
jgi:DNA-binding MarR family transcriptional regulator/predicted GNAT family acetyltransferase